MWKVKDELYFELEAEQRSDDWFNGRKRTLTGSVIEKALGWSKYATREEVLSDILGKSAPKIINEAMQRGIDGEDDLRRFFMSEVLSDWSYREPGLCLGFTVYDFLLPDGVLFSERYGSMKENFFHPQWFLAASPDGIAWNGNERVVLECKCPEYLYENLFYSRVQKNIVQHPYEGSVTINSKIKLDHLLQMYGQMAATQTKRAYYIVGYEKPEPGIFYELVEFNQDFWQMVIYPAIVHFITNYLIPSLSEEDRLKHVEKVAGIVSSNFFEEKLIFCKKRGKC